MVNYCMVFQGDLNMVSQFQVKTMAECEEEGCMDCETRRVPDHSVLMWNLALAGNREVHAQKVRTGDEGGTNRHFIVPSDYLSGEAAAINWNTEEFQSIDNDQVKLDAVYANLVELMASGLVEVRSKHKKSQKWFTKKLVELKRSVRKAESAWLRSRPREDKSEKG